MTSLDLFTFANTAIGAQTLSNTTTGSSNTAIGFKALYRNITGARNQAVGYRAMYYNLVGGGNVAVGLRSLYSATAGFYNTVIGNRTMFLNETGGTNTALGSRALYSNTTGHFNTAIGQNAGFSLTTGSYNIAIGIGSYGEAAETGTTRIGGIDLQTRTYIEGISSTPVSGAQVRITAGDQLGVVASSSRFKQDVRDLQGVSEQLTDLRPVSFRYKDEVAGKSTNPIEYGLIAEEVAKVFPELVVNDSQGRPFTVRYDLLTPLLLHELQRQNDEIAALRRRLDSLEQRTSSETR